MCFWAQRALIAGSRDAGQSRTVTSTPLVTGRVRSQSCAGNSSTEQAIRLAISICICTGSKSGNEGEYFIQGVQRQSSRSACTHGMSFIVKLYMIIVHEERRTIHGHIIITRPGVFNRRTTDTIFY